MEERRWFECWLGRLKVMEDMWRRWERKGKDGGMEHADI